MFSSLLRTPTPREESSASHPKGSESRSTSAGRSSSGEFSENAWGRASSAQGDESDRSKLENMPHLSETSNLVIRNTFIDGPLSRPLSLEGFFQERTVHSCPCSRPISFDEFGAPPGLNDIGLAAAGKNKFMSYPVDRIGSFDEMVGERQPSFPVSRGASMDSSGGWQFGMLAGVHEASTLGADIWAGPLPMPAQPPHGGMWTPSHTAVEAPPSAARIILSDCIPYPEDMLGSSAFPTRGSAGHGSGSCRPCAFLHTKGCNNGVECSFCHLCPRGEKKRRQKDKKDMIKMIRDCGRAA